MRVQAHELRGNVRSLRSIRTPAMNPIRLLTKDSDESMSSGTTNAASELTASPGEPINLLKGVRVCSSFNCWTSAPSRDQEARGPPALLQTHNSANFEESTSGARCANIELRGALVSQALVNPADFSSTVFTVCWSAAGSKRISISKAGPGPLS